MKSIQKNKKPTRQDQVRSDASAAISKDPKERAQENVVLHTPGGEMPDPSVLPSKSGRPKK